MQKYIFIILLAANHIYACMLDGNVLTLTFIEINLI